ncbi:MAG: GAF domain-containing protein [Anaerolineaceae bacterium]|nr:GAF domain-containing protein [Anaerolineaceae bacterium]
MPNDHERALRQKEADFQLIQAIDGVRDALQDDGDPQTMFDSIAGLLLDAFQAEACAIMLVAETSDDMECLSVKGFLQDEGIQLCRQAMDATEPALLSPSSLQHTVGVQIILDDYPMGSFVIGRSSTPFTQDELERIAVAESQIDSAVIQARMIWKLTQRNRELEAIYEIDRLRDRTSLEGELIAGFTSILLRHFEAGVCIVILSNIDSGEYVVRGLVDKHQIPPEAMETIQTHARQIEIPQVIPTPPGVENLVMLAAPFVVASARLGAIVIGRETTFSVADHRLLHAMISQMDSAVIYSRIFQQLDRRKKELEVIYKIDRIRDQEKDLDKMLLAVLQELCDVVSSEMGYIMLYNEQHEDKLELRSFTTGSLLTEVEYAELIQQASREALDIGEIVFFNQPGEPVHSLVAIPLILNDRIIGVFGVVNSTHTQGFSLEDRQLLVAITSQVDTAIFERLEQRRMRAVLKRSVDPKVLERLLQQADSSLLSGERVNISVVFADLRGSTEWAERTQPEEFVRVLNIFLGQMTEIIFKYQGTLDKFVGDQVIGLFGAPIHMDDHAHRAAAAALEMQVAQRELRTQLQKEGRELPPMGVGISTGEAIAGELGPPIRTDFTALGRIMNLGSRLCGAAEGDQVLISEATYERIKGVAKTNNLGIMQLKGIQRASEVHELLSIGYVVDTEPRKK